MPRAPSYQPNQTGPVQVTNERIRAVDNGGGAFGAIGKGLQTLGGAANDYAVAQDRLDDQFDETAARDVMVQAKLALGQAESEFKALEGKNALDARPAYEERLTKIRDEALAKTSNPRMRGYFEKLYEPYDGETRQSIAGHSVSQATVYQKGVYASEVELHKADAVRNFDEPEKFAKDRDDMFAASDRLSAMLGESDEMKSLRRQKVGSEVLDGVLDQMLSGPFPDVTLAEAFVDAHEDEWLDGGADARARLKQPLEERAAYNGFLEITAGMPGGGKGTEAGQTAGTFADPLRGAGGAPIPGGRYGAKRDYGGHQGADFTGKRGAPVYSGAGAGTVRVSSSKNGGNIVTIDHGGGVVTKYMHLDKVEVKDGQRVDGNTPIGTVGMTGRTSGPHLHYEVIVNDKHVDPSDLAGKPSGTRDAGPRLWDKDAVYSKADAKVASGEWTFEYGEAVKRRADREIATDENLQQRQWAQAQREASQFIIDKGEGFTDVSQIPKSIRDRMDPLDLAQAEDTAKRNKARRDAVPTNGADAMQLEIMKRMHPDQFANLDLSKYVGKVSDGELRGFVLDQASILGKPPPKEDDMRSAISGEISFQTKMGGPKIEDADFPAVFDVMDAYLKDRKRKQGYITAADRKEAYMAATRAGPSGAHIYDLQYDQIPSEKVSEITRAFKAQFGREPTEDEIVQIRRRMLAGVKP